jgi:hypothetical protein
VLDVMLDEKEFLNPYGIRALSRAVDYLLLYEYFHGDNGAGLGVRHRLDRARRPRDVSVRH